jgi:hypothetical protein
VPHISLVFREMWDTTSPDRSPPKAESNLKKSRGQVRGIPYLAKNERDMGHPRYASGKDLRYGFRKDLWLVVQ